MGTASAAFRELFGQRHRAHCSSEPCLVKRRTQGDARVPWFEQIPTQIVVDRRDGEVVQILLGQGRLAIQHKDTDGLVYDRCLVDERYLIFLQA